MLAHERPHLTQLHRIGTDQERQRASLYRKFDKPSWNDRCLRAAANGGLPPVQSVGGD